MARRILLAAALVALAVAGPAAADAGVPDPSAPTLQVDPTDPLDATAGLVVFLADQFMAAGMSTSAEALMLTGLHGISIGGSDGGEATASCRVYDLTMPGQNTPLDQAFTLDPEGCLRGYVRDYLRQALGWAPPVAESSPALSIDGGSASPSGTNLL